MSNYSIGFDAEPPAFPATRPYAARCIRPCGVSSLEAGSRRVCVEPCGIRTILSCEGRRIFHMAGQFQLAVLLGVISLAHAAAADTLQGRWKLLAAEDLRTNGEVGRLPWGAHPIGSLVVSGGWCYVQ